MSSAAVDMVKSLVFESASKIGVTLYDVNLVDGCSVGILDADLIYIYAGDRFTSSLMYLTDLEGGKPSDGLKLRVSAALTRLSSQH